MTFDVNHAFLAAAAYNKLDVLSVFVGPDQSSWVAVRVSDPDTADYQCVQFKNTVNFDYVFAGRGTELNRVPL